VTKARLPKSRKTVRTNRQRPAARRLLSLRSAVVLQFALLTGIGGAALLFLGHATITETALGGCAIFAAALKFINELIELGVHLALPCVAVVAQQAAQLERQHRAVLPWHLRPGRV